MITVIDYGLGNISAFTNVYHRLNIDVNIARSPSELSNATKLILPGVGAFDYAMSQLNRSGMRDEVEKLVIGRNVPLVGICVGMQMLGNGSEEGRLPGLGWIDAEVRRFPQDINGQTAQLPHMGWNSISPTSGKKILEALDCESRFYFLHSYYVSCNNVDDVIATTEYGIEFASCINHKNIFGIQFHPEKSHSNGVRLLSNFHKIT